MGGVVGSLFDNTTFLWINFEILKILAWLGGSYFLAWGIIQFKKGWIKDSKSGLFKAILYLIPGILLVCILFKQILMKGIYG